MNIAPAAALPAPLPATSHTGPAAGANRPPPVTAGAPETSHSEGTSHTGRTSHNVDIKV